MALASALVMLTTRAAVAEFVGGVEQFNGNVKDAVTWQEYVGGGEVISQNGALTIADPTGTGSKTGDYTTKQVALLPGSMVSVNVTCSQGGLASIFLTNNSVGNTASTAFDSYWTEIELGVSTNAPNGAISRFTGGNGSGGNFGSIATLANAIDQTFKLQIERPNSTDYIYRAYNSTGTLLGSSSFAGAAHPEALFVSLAAINGMTATWDDVTVSGNVVPEPVTVGVVGAMALLAARPSRWRGC